MNIQKPKINLTKRNQNIYNNYLYNYRDYMQIGDTTE